VAGLVGKLWLSVVVYVLEKQSMRLFTKVLE
jgi:hypothetical protein